MNSIQHRICFHMRARLVLASPLKVSRGIPCNASGILARSISLQPDGSYHVSEDRLQELMRRDIAHLASEPMQSFSLQQLFTIANDDLVRLCQAEGPKRLALRIRLLEGLPGWYDVPELVEMHNKLSRWFKALRLLPSDCQTADIIQCVKAIRQDGEKVVALVTAGIKRLQLNDPERFSDAFLDRWLDDFFLSRVGTSTLADHLVSRAALRHGGRARPTGIIDPQCNATNLCNTAAHFAQAMCVQARGQEIPFRIENYTTDGFGGPSDSPCIFPYIPNFLSFSVLELLKNSFKATADVLKKSDGDASNHPISIKVCRDDHNVAILISDRGGGIPLQDEDRIWSYLYGAAAQGSTTGGSNFSGFGVGLPLSRLYIRYLGGRLSLTTYPGYGTQAHILLPRIDADQIEVLPEEASFTGSSGFGERKLV